MSYQRTKKFPRSFLSDDGSVLRRVSEIDSCRVRGEITSDQVEKRPISFTCAVPLGQPIDRQRKAEIINGRATCNRALPLKKDAPPSLDSAEADWISSRTGLRQCVMASVKMSAQN